MSQASFSCVGLFKECCEENGIVPGAQKQGIAQMRTAQFTKGVRQETWHDKHLKGDVLLGSQHKYMNKRRLTSNFPNCLPSQSHAVLYPTASGQGLLEPTVFL
jgi:hypothetical protein